MFIDSLNFLPVALSRLPKTFGLTNVLKKGYFPHFFNTVANQDYVGPIPEARYYGLNGMYTEARGAVFMEWHGKQVRDGVVFDFRKELLEYCRSRCGHFAAVLSWVSAFVHGDDRWCGPVFEPDHCVGVHSGLSYQLLEGGHHRDDSARGLSFGVHPVVGGTGVVGV